MTAPTNSRNQYVVDAQGRRVAVVLDIATYEAMIERLEALDDLLAVDEADSDREPARSAEDVFREIERERGWRTE